MKRLAASLKRTLLPVACGALGMTLGAAAVVVVQSRSDSALQPWHTELLSEEFSAAKADEITSFHDYQRLEDRLFAELDRKVYERTETGPAWALVRYSRGSAADPGRRDGDWNRSFELVAGGTSKGGVLLLHGMSDGPYSLRALGEALYRQGYHVLGLRLPGHGTAPSGMLRVTWEDMAAAVRLGMRHLAATTGEGAVHVIGYSTGAPLALDYALNARADGTPMPASLVLVSPAIGVSRAAAAAVWLDRLSVLPGLETLAWTQILPEFDPYKYNSFTSNAGFQVYRLTRSVAQRIEQAAAGGPISGFPPTLVFLSAADATVSTAAVVDALLDHLAPEQHQLVLFDVNRQSVTSTVLISDPGPLTARLMADRALPFALTLVRNESEHERTVVSRHKPALSTRPTTERLGLAWPSGVISLSHVALPFPPDDPLYGEGPPPADGLVFLGQIPAQGERGLLLFSADWLVRLRHNPFYGFMQTQTLAWLDAAGDRPGR